MEYEDFHLVKIGDHTFVLEQCKDFSKGLSNREHLLENEGMKDCYLPLDILFIKEGKIQKIYHNCSPCETEECQKFEHDSADTIIELLGGTCESNNISEGLIYRLM